MSLKFSESAESGENLRKSEKMQEILKIWTPCVTNVTWNSQNLEISQEILRKSEEMQKFLKIWIVRKNTKKRAKEIWNLGMWRKSEEIWEIPQKFNSMAKNGQPEIYGDC